jgi:hypothetical protein
MVGTLLFLAECPTVKVIEFFFNSSSQAMKQGKLECFYPEQFFTGLSNDYKAEAYPNIALLSSIKLVRGQTL